MLTCRSLRKSLWKIAENKCYHVLPLQMGFPAARNTHSKADNDLISPKHEALTLLHKVSKFLPLALDQKGIGPRTSHWNDILSRIHRDLSSQEERPVKLLGTYR
jgi:hypothetical protein